MKTITKVKNNPVILKFWDYTLNDINLLQVSHSSKEIVNWVCPDVDGHRWTLSINNLRNTPQCPFCKRLKPSLEYNLKTEYPLVASEWDYDKNLDRPENYLPKSNMSKWWMCNKCKYGWTAIITDRTYAGSGCPKCSGRVVSDNNRLSVLHPELVEEIYLPSLTVDVNNISKGSHQHLDWKCKKCSRIWKSSVKDRVRGNGCPSCKLSKGELRIEKFLKKNCFQYLGQYRFVNSSIKTLKYDFAVWIDGDLRLIEFHGEQHWTKWRSSSLTEEERQDRLIATQIRDAKKAKYCEDNNIPLLVIPFWQMDNVELILTAWLTP